MKRNEVALWASILIAGGAGRAEASMLTGFEAGVILQSSINDGDLYFLTRFYGFNPGEQLAYSSSNDTSGWTGNLSGTYMGTNVNVAYAGDLAAYPGGAVTWTTTGSYGGNSWSGSGNATISDTLTGVEIVFHYALNIGNHVGTWDYDATASVTPGNPYPTVILNDSDSTASAVADGQEEKAHPSYLQLGRKFISDITVEGKGGRVTDSGLKPTSPPPPIGLLTNSIVTVPEPSGLLLAGIGLVGPLAYALRPRRRAA